MRRALLVLIFSSCGVTAFIPGPDGGSTGGGTASSGGGSAGTGGGSTGLGGSGTGGAGASGGAGGGTMSSGGGATGGNGGGGTNGMSCMSACDCAPGESCRMGMCRMGMFSVACCDDPMSCTPGMVCQHMNGMFGQCPSGGDAGYSTPDGGRCQSACDCTPGDACFQGNCVSAPVAIYCCTDPMCPAMERCQNPGGGQTHRCGSDGGMFSFDAGFPGTDGGSYCSLIPCNMSGGGLCQMAGCSACDPSGTCVP